MLIIEMLGKFFPTIFEIFSHMKWPLHAKGTIGTLVSIDFFISVSFIDLFRVYFHQRRIFLDHSLVVLGFIHEIIPYSVLLIGTKCNIRVELLLCA